MKSDFYNILWIDDEWDKMTTFKCECEEMHHLHLEPFRTRKDGMDAFDQNPDHWHAALLDAKMYDEDENEVPKLTGLRKAKQHLDTHGLSYFISTGQADLISNDDFSDLVGKYYIKGNDDEKLIKDMLLTIENSEEYKVRVLYNDVFSALIDLNISQYADAILINILVPLHFPAKDQNFKPGYHYNKLRHLIEYLFRAFNTVGILPDVCIDEKQRVNLNQSSLYLAGKNATILGIRYGDEGARVIPEYIESIVHAVLDLGNVHSHTAKLESEDEQKLSTIFQSAKSRYIIFGLTLQMCEVIIWFAHYFNEHNNREVNLSFCKQLGYQLKYKNKEFVPEQDENGNWHCKDCLVLIWESKPGKIRLTEVSPNTNNQTKSIYPYFARYQKLK